MAKISGQFTNEPDIKRVFDSFAYIGGEKYGFEVTVTSIRKREDASAADMGRGNRELMTSCRNPVLQTETPAEWSR